VILAIIAKIGTAGGTGHVSIRWQHVRGMSMEGRNDGVQHVDRGGARAGLVAPDDKTFAYLMGRPRAPEGRRLEQALAY